MTRRRSLLERMATRTTREVEQTIEHRSFRCLDERQSVESECHARMQRAHMYCDAINRESAHQGHVHHDSREGAS
jgi:hypothetical protein